MMTKVLFGGRVNHEQRDAVTKGFDAAEHILVWLARHVHAVHFNNAISLFQSYNVKITALAVSW